VRVVLDVVVSSVVLLTTAPLMLMIALFIKLDSKGPVLFRHQRIGQDRRRDQAPPYDGPDRRQSNLYGRPFTLYKFRSMYTDARDRFPELYAYDYSEEELRSLPIKVLVGSKHVSPDVEASHDPRVTRVGRWLRRTSLDELPNFINVLRGDMHLVGPRPDIYENIRYYPPEHRPKLRVRPGITGLPQIMGRGRLSFFETNELDVRYVRRRSLLGDVRILLKTLVVALRGEGAY
jgi:lipopolysaccharide/colanic/teichoic acid biosynthesis glycosyltransferase